jgi:hypothetical protein
VSNVRLLIVYDPPGAVSPLTLAEVEDRAVIREVSRRVIAEADKRANLATDPEAAFDEQANARHLRQVLPLIVPGLELSPAQ